MMKDTEQQKFWKSNFGKEYTSRNWYEPTELDEFYKKTYGVSRSAMNNEFLKDIKLENVLEVGCNIGNQLRLLQKQGYRNLFGIEIQQDAVDKAREISQDIDIRQGSAFALPYKDSEFDLVFTAGVLIHISPDDINQALDEIYRTSKKYIWGLEYFAPQYQEINYRGNQGFLWKANFSKLYVDRFSDLTLVKEKKYRYVDNDNEDVMFLLEKK